MTIDGHGQQTLLRVARDAIGHGLVHADPPEVAAGDYPEPLRQIACTFVTLHMGQNLRGCIGSLRAHRPLVADVARHAHAAAFCDARFGPLQHTELAGLHIHVSILSALEPLSFDSDDTLLTLLRPREHGLLIEIGGQRATFLPTVWSSLPDGRDFLAALKKKAGVQTDITQYNAWRYTTLDFEESSDS
jgi:AmmeMemoRadiSam system protein A